MVQTFLVILPRNHLHGPDIRPTRTVNILENLRHEGPLKLVLLDHGADKDDEEEVTVEGACDEQRGEHLPEGQRKDGVPFKDLKLKQLARYSNP